MSEGDAVNDVALVLGDCLEWLPTLEPQSIDAICTDLPYGQTSCAWDTVIPFAPMWEQVRRILKPRGVFVTTASQPFTSALVMSNLEWFRYALVWEKQQPTGFLDARRKPLKSHEDICVFSGERATYNPQGTQNASVQNGRHNKAGNGCYGSVGAGDYMQTIGNFPRSVLRFDRVTYAQLHPTQKPVALYEYLIRTYTNPGDTVLDFVMGSGTTGVAAVQTGRRFVGCEISPEYFEIARRRIADAQARPRLFEDAPVPTAQQQELLT